MYHFSLIQNNCLYSHHRGFLYILIDTDIFHCLLLSLHPENINVGLLSNRIGVSKQCRGGSRISGMGSHMFKSVGIRLAEFIPFFLNIPWKRNNLVSVRPNYFIFIGFLKRGTGRFERTPWTPYGSTTAMTSSESVHETGLQINACDWKLFFLFLNQNIWDGSFKYPKHMFRLRGIIICPFTPKISI